MKILFLGTPIDSGIEQDLNSSESCPVGFKVTIIYTEEYVKSQKCPKSQILNNVTQVHSRFASSYITARAGRERIAFESDVHQTGGWKYIHAIALVTIEYAEKKEAQHKPGIE